MPYIGRGSDFGVRSRFIYTATAGQTTFSGNDDAGITLAYTDTLYMDVYQNGVLLVPATDYAASTGTSVVLVQGASVGDTVELLVHDIFSVADAVSAKDGGTFSGTIAAAGYSSSTAGTSNYIAGVNAGDAIQAGGNYNVTVGDEAGTAITTGDNNVLLGYAAGDAITTSGNHVAIGSNALSTVTTVGSLTAVGDSALKVNAGGYGNTAIGANALTANTSGNNNTTLGQNAGVAVTSGSGNTFVGQGAGDGTDDGVNNVAVGIGALSANAVGENVAIGNSSLAVCTASNNTAVGASSGKAVTSGSQNVFVGNDAGLAVIGGANHVAVGYRALRASTSANGNTAVGRDAGLVVTGGGNTFIGDAAGDSTTTGSNNICIGSSTDTAAVDNSNAIVIGVGITTNSNDFTFGKASNEVTNDFDADASFSRSSDERLKKNITNQKLGLDFINDLRTVKYNWKPSNELDASDPELAHLRREDEDGNIINDMNTSAVMHNFIAQEVRASLDKAGVPDFGGWKLDKYGVQQVSREMFVIPLVKAVQELSEKNDALEARLAALEAK